MVITFSFNTAINVFGVDIFDLGDNNTTLDIYLGMTDQNNNLAPVNSFGLNNYTTNYATSGQANFWGIVSEHQFNTVTFDLSSWDWYTIDNIVAGNASTVPESTTMLLFGTGLASLAAVGRRRK